MRSDPVDNLVAIMAGDPDDNVRLAASEFLRMVGSPAAVPGFAQAAVADRDGHVRCSAAPGLVDFGDSRAVPTLIDWVLHGNNPFRGILGLRNAGDPAVIPFLTALRGHLDKSSEQQLETTINELRSTQLRLGPVPDGLDDIV